MENKIITIDYKCSVIGQVSNYLKERAIINYIKSKVDNQENQLIHEDKVLNANNKLLDQMYNRLLNDKTIKLKQLLAPLKK